MERDSGEREKGEDGGDGRRKEGAINRIRRFEGKDKRRRKEKREERRGEKKERMGKEKGGEKEG